MGNIEIIVRGLPKTGKSALAFLLADRLGELLPGQVKLEQDEPIEQGDLVTEIVDRRIRVPLSLKQFRDSKSSICIKMEQV